MKREPAKLRLGEITRFVSGGTPSKQVPRYWGGTTPWVSAKDLKSLHIDSSIDTLSDSGRDVASLVPRGTLLILVRGMTLFKSIPIGIASRELAINQDLKGLITNGVVSPEFLAYSLLAKESELLQMVEASGHGTGRLDTDALKDILVRVPSLPEQHQIVSAIATWDAAIHKTEQLIVAKEKKLATVRQKLFSRSSREGYVRVRLDSILKETRELSDGKLPVYSVSVHKGLIDQVEHLGRPFSAATTSHYTQVRPGDLVYTKSPTGNFPYGIVKKSFAIENAAVSPLYGVYRPSTTDIGTLVDFFFESPVNAKNYLHPLVQKGAKNTISIGNDQFLKGEISLPESAEQIARLSLFISAARAEIALLKKSAAALKLQKRGLMKKLLTGQWRLPIAQRATV